MNGPDSPRNLVWRGVRDAGQQGISGTKLIEQLKGKTNAGWVYRQLNLLADGGFIVRRFVAGVWIVNGDCRVPSGESPHLGPGWTDADADLVDHAHREAA